MTRFSTYLLTLALLPVAAGCADEGDAEDCVGLNCPNGFQWPYGGEIRLWYIELPDGSQLQRLIGFFIEAQTPDQLPPNVEIGYCAENLESAPGFGYGENRQYIDVGESITFNLADDRQVEVPKVTGSNFLDFAGRPHDLAYLRDVSDPPGPDFFDNTHSITTGVEMDFSAELSPGVYMTPDFEVIQPLGVPIILRSGRDLVIEWEEEKTPNPDYATVAAMVFIPDAGPGYQCIVKNDGKMTVPAEIIDIFEADTGVMVIGTASNAAVLRPDGRFQSMFAMNCHLTPFQRVP